MNTPTHINKERLLEQVIAAIEADLARLRAGLELAKTAKFESATRMQSRYDTFGVESSWVADGLATNLSERLEALRQLNIFKLPRYPRSVCLGCLVGIGPVGGEVQDLYFVLPAGGGIVLPVPEPAGEVSVITPNAPVGRMLANKECGATLRTQLETGASLGIVFLA